MKTLLERLMPIAVIMGIVLSIATVALWPVLTRITSCQKGGFVDVLKCLLS